MLHKLNDLKLIKYQVGSSSIKLTSKGELIGQRMMRNTRLLEFLMKHSLKIEIDEEMVCGIEHHMKSIFTDELCTLLNIPGFVLMVTSYLKEVVAVRVSDSYKMLFDLRILQ